MKKLFVVIVIVLLAFLLVGAFKGPEKASDYKQYIIQSGDTLWGIAVENTPESRDCRDTISEIKEVNGIGNEIYTGQIIVVPVYED